MKRIFSYIIVMTMIITGCGIGLFPVAVSAANTGNTIQKDKPKKNAEYKEGEAIVLLKSSSTLSKSKVKSSVDIGGDAAIEKLWCFTTESEATPGDGKTILRKNAVTASSSVNIVLVKSKTLTTKQLIEQLKKKKNVELAEPNYKIKALDLNINDTYKSHQWGLDNTGQNGGTEESSTNVNSKWTAATGGTTGSHDNVVAVVDTGVDYTHEDLKGSIWENPYNPKYLKGEHGFDFVNSDNDPIDDNGHGSHCAGIIGAEGNNSVGVSGVNQNVQIMALKILDYEGSGYASEEIGAYHYINKALDLGVKVKAINNSWGGGEGSEIFEELVNIVGAKGAVTVCAAGNEANDNDKYAEYPAAIDSEYKLSVAATNEDSELANFSNYGKSSVDIAAPGTDILSTVSYDCYNPSLYDAAKQEQVTQVGKFNDFEDAANTWGIPEESTFSGSKGSTAAAVYKAETSDAEYFGTGKSGKSQKLTFKGLKAGECATVRIPYTLSEDVTYENAPRFSVMAKASGPKDEYEEAVLGLCDAPKGTSVNDIYEVEYSVVSTYIDGENNYWDHFEVSSGDDDAEPATERELVIIMQAGAAGDYTVYLDDLGLSKELKDTSGFGKYDFYNGTSMATPFVTGAIALIVAGNQNADSLALIDELRTYVKEEPAKLGGKVSSEGVLDFSREVTPGPRIGSITVDVSKSPGQIKIKGGGFGDNPTVKVDTDPSDSVEGETAKILTKSAKELIIENKGWINCYVTITVTGANEKTAEKKGVYLVKGKTAYTEMDEGFEFPSNEGIMATNGRNIYCADSSSDTIYMADTADKEDMEFEDAAEVTEKNIKKFFKTDSNSLATFDFSFGSDLTYMDGKLYNIAAYSQVSEGGGSDDDFFWSNEYEGKASSVIIISDDEEEEGGTTTAYSSENKLLSFDPSTGKVVNLGELPSDISRIDDYSLASYNGKLYLIGGYDYGNKTVSKKVKVYNPATKKWANGPSLPAGQGRAGGRVIQSGNSLVYTMGYSENQKDKSLEAQECPVNLILTGNTWKASDKKITPYFYNNSVKRSGSEYIWYDASIGICAGGILYMGTPVEQLGDTFAYNVKADNMKGRFAATKYHKVSSPYMESFTGITVGGSLYGFDYDDYAYKAAISSGLVKVTAAKSNKGSIVGANKGYMPGTKVTLTAKAKKGYYVKTFKVNGAKVSGKTKTIRITDNQTAYVSFSKYVSKIKLNKKDVTLAVGESFKLKAKVYPSNATNKKISYTSSNKKYATVSAKGVVKAKKAGQGKNVTIKAKAKDGSKKSAKCIVRIK